VADNGVGSINAGGLAAMLDAYKVGFYRPNEIPIELQRGGQHQRGGERWRRCWTRTRLGFIDPMKSLLNYNGVGSINAGGLAAMLDAYKVGFYRMKSLLNCKGLIATY
jgi:hypothetical protein